VTITGSTLRPRPVEFKAQIAREAARYGMAAAGGGRIKPVIHKVFRSSRQPPRTR
jgi:NADPH2:quinone reductase